MGDKAGRHFPPALSTVHRSLATVQPLVEAYNSLVREYKEEVMTAVDRIIRELTKLPEPLLGEVLDFIAFLEEKHGLKEAASDQLKSAQTPAMGNIWNNPEDEVWNDA